MKNPFKRRLTHVAIVDGETEVGDEIVMLCGVRRDWLGPVDNSGKVIRMCGDCMELALKEYPADEINDLLGRMHDASHLLNDLRHPLNSVFDLHEALTEVFNRDGAAAAKYKRG